MNIWIETMGFKPIVELEEPDSKEGWFFLISSKEGKYIGEIQIHKTLNNFLMFKVLEVDRNPVKIYPLNRRAIFTSLTDIVDDIKNISDSYTLKLPYLLKPSADIDIPLMEQTFEK